MGNEKDIQLTEGSHYEVKSLSTREDSLLTKGYFRGYIQIGKHQALNLELDDSHEEEGQHRVIPCHMITSIDVIDQAEPDEKEKQDTNTYFG